ncbi:MAG: roadblock/LC7 domain-containing protein [Deltaproteobacteria bacterium]|nr:roadblock/LC7 domain-containing protein [Deltaproteobacteria bacterium]
MRPPFVLFQEESQRLSALCEALLRGAHARGVFLLHRDGQVIAQWGDLPLDTTALASLVAGAVAAAGGLAQLVGEAPFPALLHEGARRSLHTSLVGDKLLLVVLFDERSSPALVRLKLKDAHRDLLALSEDLAARPLRALTPLFAELSDDDIDDLFGES